MSPGGTEGAEGDCMPGTSGQPCTGRPGQGYRNLVAGYFLEKTYSYLSVDMLAFYIFMKPCVK